MTSGDQEVYLIRHGETEWSRIGRHTGKTDLPLTEEGRMAALLLQPVLASEEFSLVLSSPMRRARETSELAGLGARARTDPELMEWSYGEYEGMTHEEIHRKAPGWSIFTHGCPGGESPEHMGARLDGVIARIRSTSGNVALIGHGHFFRALAARWLGFPVAEGRRFLLDTASLSVLGYYRDVPALKRWNARVFSEG